MKLTQEEKVLSTMLKFYRYAENYKEYLYVLELPNNVFLNCGLDTYDRRYEPEVNSKCWMEDREYLHPVSRDTFTSYSLLSESALVALETAFNPKRIE